MRLEISSHEDDDQRHAIRTRVGFAWITDLKEMCESARSTRNGRKCTVDLEGVILVDRAEENVAMGMVAEEAVLLAGRAYRKHVSEPLKEPQA